MYFKGAGQALVAPRDANGNATVFRYLGRTRNGAKFGLKTDTGILYEAETGQNLPALRYEKSKDASLSFEMEDFQKANVAMALRSVAADISAGTVTAEVLANPIAVGDIVRTVKPKISSVVVKDSTGTPKILTAGTNYQVYSDAHGSIKFLDVTTGGPYVQPFKADYSNALATNVPMFTTPQQEYWVRFELLNTSPDAGVALGAKVLIEFYRVTLDALAEWLLKGTDPAVMSVTGAALYDDSKAADAVLGQFGRVVLV